MRGDIDSLRKAIEVLIADERSKNHRVLADRLNSLLNESPPIIRQSQLSNQNGAKDLVFEVNPEKKLTDLVLDGEIVTSCKELVEEHQRIELLKSYGLPPRNKILLTGPPGNGKTSLAEAIAYELMYPILVIRYDSLIGSYLGETASRLQKVFEIARTRKCVLFFDEFETLGKERGDNRETGEIKRVVSSLLLQIDRIPSHTIVITASNHPELLDRAVWRRFQIIMELPNPEKQQILSFLEKFEEKTQFKFGKSHKVLADKLFGGCFSEVEDFCIDVLRQAILQRKQDNPKQIVDSRLKKSNKKLPSNIRGNANA
ncbi:MAG: ATP-binding protein [Deltaproteobacteria bacterium]|nr:ATP-binding protein [Deltaproteobacteria bacterium]